MADVTILHWNIETFGPSRYTNNPNNNYIILYIASVIERTNSEIVCLVEIIYSVAVTIVGDLLDAVSRVQGLDPTNSPWRAVAFNNNFNHEGYVILYRTDKSFLPYSIVNAAAGANQTPAHGLANLDTAGNAVPFPTPHTPGGGRTPGFALFQTTDNNRFFSVLTYHAMFGQNTARGVQNVPRLAIIQQFGAGPTAIQTSLISGDFNVDYTTSPGDYANMLALPSTPATTQLTSIKNDPKSSDDPLSFRANAYDNIFQKTPVTARVGVVTDLMVESAVILPPAKPPPAAQPYVGYLVPVMASWEIQHITQHKILNPIVKLPPDSMDTAWDFVRECISNHYPVSVKVTI